MEEQRKDVLHEKLDAWDENDENNAACVVVLPYGGNVKPILLNGVGCDRALHLSTG